MAETEQVASGASIRITAEIMVAVVIAVFVAFVFLFFLYLHAKRYWGAIPAAGRSPAQFLSSGDGAAAAPPRRGLDPAAVEALPSMPFRPREPTSTVECAVCLSEVSEGEEVRLLPRCGHGFHLECIDMWFRSNSTCPLCRCPVQAPDPGAETLRLPTAEPAGLGDGQPPSLPANVLFWGSSSSGPSPGKPESSLVAEIPRRAAEGYPSPISPPAFKSPSSARLKSLGKKLLIRGNRGAASSCCPGAVDIEQGVPESE